MLVLDPRISGFLGLFAEVPLLKEHGVEQCALILRQPSTFPEACMKAVPRHGC